MGIFQVPNLQLGLLMPSFVLFVMEKQRSCMLYVAAGVVVAPLVYLGRRISIKP